MAKKAEVIVAVVIAGSFLFFIVVMLVALSGIYSRESVSIKSFGKKVAIIDVHGAINDSKDIISQIKRYSSDNSVPVILLHIDSPGGVVAPTQEIYQELKRAKEKNKKIVVSMGSLAASGGYYIACIGDSILADPGTLTGSIGVVFSYPVVEKLFTKIGVNYEVIKSREFKDIGSPYRATTFRDREALQSVIDDVYDQFVSTIVENRRLPRGKVLQLADGRIFSGRQARQLGLVDELGGLEDAIKVAGRMAGIKGEPRTVREIRRERISVLDLLGGKANPLLGMDYRDFFEPKLEYIYR